MGELEKWIELYACTIERLAFQYGCSQEQAGEVAEETFDVLIHHVEKMAEGKLYVYKVALEKLAQTQRVNLLSASPIRFEEDAEFHSTIIQLDETYRVPLILHVFHGLTMKEIADMTTCSIDEVEATIQIAKESLREEIGNPPVDVLEKRFEFLLKSYERLPVLFNADNVGREESTPIVQGRKKIGRKGRFTAIILAVLLAGLIGGSYFTSVDWELRSDRKYIAKLEKEFAKKLKKSRRY